MKILLIPAEEIDPVDQLSANTLRRCEAGLTAWNSGDYDFLLLSGGIFLPSTRQTKSAASTMEQWFVAQGVEPDCIWTEDQSLDTYENIRLGLRVMNTQLGMEEKDITVLTQYQHAIRFLLTFWLAHRRRIKIIPIRQPAMSWKSWFLEWVVLIPYHFLDRRGTWFLARRNRQARTRAAAI